MRNMATIYKVQFHYLFGKHQSLLQKSLMKCVDAAPNMHNSLLSTCSINLVLWPKSYCLLNAFVTIIAHQTMMNMKHHELSRNQIKIRKNKSEKKKTVHNVQRGICCQQVIRKLIIIWLVKGIDCEINIIVCGKYIDPKF